MIKGSVHQGDITRISIYVANNNALKYKKHKPPKIKRERQFYSDRDLNTLFSLMDITTRQMINKETEDMNDLINQLTQQISIEYSTKQQHIYYF